ncbi:hypothetical protein [Marinibacterium profundimaris]|uniref:hypothetical protein n=1 Tax=Marinibacterium profundimaris TaxID=1679460 RepID=UPI000B52666C|nr:hypothetical protein [Marinibacterium profundimaris]
MIGRFSIPGRCPSPCLTRCLILCLALVGLPLPLPPAPAAALPHAPVDQVRLFAQCAGRYSALAEHEALFDGAASERAQARRDLYVELMEAVLPDAAALSGGTALAWRIAAKHAQSVLLRRATFLEDPAAAARSRRAAEYHFAECRASILGG